MKTPELTMAEQVAQAVIAFQKKATGHAHQGGHRGPQ